MKQRSQVEEVRGGMLGLRRAFGGFTVKTRKMAKSGSMREI